MYGGCITQCLEYIVWAMVIKTAKRFVVIRLANGGLNPNLFLGSGEGWKSRRPERRAPERRGGLERMLPQIKGRKIFEILHANLYILVLFGVFCLGQQCRAKILEGRKNTLHFTCEPERFVLR